MAQFHFQLEGLLRHRDRMEKDCQREIGLVRGGGFRRAAMKAHPVGGRPERCVQPKFRVGIRERQQAVSAPPGFEDAIAWVGPLEPGHSPHWHVTIAVGDRDATALRARSLGAEVLDEQDSPWTRTALVRDPQGAVFTVSQFTPPA